MKCPLFRATALASAVLMVVGCAWQSPSAPATPPPSPTAATGFWRLPAAQVEAVSAEAMKIAKHQVEAWNSHDLGVIRGVYTPDIDHFDGYPRFIGIDEVMGMVRGFLAMSSHFEGELGETYVRGYNVQPLEWVSVWRYWNFLEYTQEDPLVEYDQLTPRDGRISYWRLFYEPGYLARSGGASVDVKLLERYAAVWSSGDAQQVAAFYAPEAIHCESVIGDYAVGRDRIRANAEGYFLMFPRVRMKLTQPIGESAPNELGDDVKMMQGGIYTIQMLDQEGRPCDVEELVLLESARTGVVSERDYFDVVSLVKCGWRR